MSLKVGDMKTRHNFKFSTDPGWSVVAFFLAVALIGVATVAAETLPNIATNDNRTPAGTLESGVLTMHLEISKGAWHPGADGPPASQPLRTIETYAFAEQGHELQTPGPLIRVRQGTEVHLTVHNLLPIETFIHGLEQHPGDGKKALELKAGETKELSFNAGEPGTYLYWATTGADQRDDSDGAMSGAFVVDGPNSRADDRIFVIQLWAKDILTPSFQGVLTINGKSWPYTERLHAHIGRSENWRIINASEATHPMHLHGFYFTVDAVGDGVKAHQLSPGEQRLVVTEVVEPHHTFDMTWMPERAGNWLFHCHILDHMTSYLSPFLYGPQGPATLPHAHDDYNHGTAMSKLVLGITVTGDGAHLVPAKAVVESPAVQRHLYIRERAARNYVPSGPGFFLEGVSKEIGAIGPPLVITRGERTAITVSNELDEPTIMHWHGIEIENYYDGVPSWDPDVVRATPAIQPGSSFVAYMTPPRAGTFIYHTHWHNAKQLTGGLYGALLVLEPGQTYDPATDKIFVLGRGGDDERHDPLVLNGSPQPSMMVLLTGQKYRFRLINMTPNDGRLMATLTTEGRPAKWRAIAKDGANLPSQQAIVSDAVQQVSVGETYDYEFVPSAPGTYELRFTSVLFGCVVTQTVRVVPPKSPLSVYVAR